MTLTFVDRRASGGAGQSLYEVINIQAMQVQQGTVDCRIHQLFSYKLPVNNFET